MAVNGQELPPERKNLVRELLCPQLLAAIVAGGLFAFTIAVPVKLPDANSVQVTKKGIETVDPLLNSPEILEKVKEKEPWVLYEKGQTKEAMAAAWKAAKDNKKRQDAAWNMAIGNTLIRSDNAKDRWKGYVVLEKTILNHPTSQYVVLNYARQLYYGGFVEKAEEQYENLLKLAKPEWIEPRIELANLYLVDEKTSRAIEVFNQVLEQKPEDPRITKRLGLAIAVNGKKEKGFETFVRGCALESDNLDYPPEIKELIEKNAGLIESAISDVRQKVENRPEDIDLRVTLAKLLIAVNRLPEARKNLKDALKKRESVPELHELMSEVLFREHNREEALGEFSSATSLLPLSRPAAPAEDAYAPTIEDTSEEAESVAPPPEEKKAEGEKPAAEAGSGTETEAK
ncbi:MAG: tetratricopeptide repeat protein [Candidatus Obscuribacterales bacterium]|nr:tetratricopeptide repeat protein [Candidatus Obscuribacterales bacterium]